MIFDQWNIFGQAVHLKKNWSISQILFAVKTQVYFMFFYWGFTKNKIL